MKPGVSLVCMNKPLILQATCARLLATLPPRTPVVMVDNGSSDEATINFQHDMCKHQWDVVRNSSNLGLSVAVNQGLEVLVGRGCDLLVHMDDDALVQTPDDWLERIMVVFEQHPELGVAMPFSTPESIPRGGYSEVRWGLGYIWALRRCAYELTGGYDPQLLHQQECDLSVRVRMAGYTVGAIPGIQVIHNDPGGPRTPLALAREHIGVVQFRDKWAQYYRGLGWNYGTFPVYLMQHWPTDQDFYDRFAKAHGLDLNPFPVNSQGKAALGPDQLVTVAGKQYFKRYSIVEDGAHWETMEGAHSRDRDLAILRWKELTGEEYTGYNWGPTPLFKVKGCRNP